MSDVPPRSRYRSALDNGVDRLYHYQRFDEEHLENTIVRDLVRFTRPSSFNDPWDCKPVFSLYGLPSCGPRCLRNAVPGLKLDGGRFRYDRTTCASTS